MQTTQSQKMYMDSWTVVKNINVWWSKVRTRHLRITNWLDAENRKWGVEVQKGKKQNKKLACTFHICFGMFSETRNDVQRWSIQNYNKIIRKHFKKPTGIIAKKEAKKQWKMILWKANMGIHRDVFNWQRFLCFWWHGKLHHLVQNTELIFQEEVLDREESGAAVFILCLILHFLSHICRFIAHIWSSQQSKLEKWLRISAKHPPVVWWRP